MKRLSLLVVVLLVGSVVLSACGGGGGDTPASVVKAWNEATSATMDAAKAKSLSCAAFQPMIDTAVEMMKAAGAKTDLSALKYEESNVTATSAVVRVYGKIKVDMAGTMTEQDFDQPVDVIKEGGKWVACPKLPTP
jgi:hypothetical protein